MPGGIGPVGPAVLAAGGRRERHFSATGGANEIFFHLDARRVYYDRRQCQLYFVCTPDDLVAHTLCAAIGGTMPPIEQLHLDSHRFFNAARRVTLSPEQANIALMALRLVGISATVG